MIRVLQVVNDMHRAGLETMLMNYYRNIDRTKIQFDFLTHRPNKSDYDDEIISMGGKVYYAPRLYPQNYSTYFKYMKQFFKDHPEYTIIHSHIDAMSYLPLLAAKKAGVPIRIAHSHNTSIDRDFKWPLKMLFREFLPGVATDFYTCGEEAGKFLFQGEKCIFIPNAIDTTKFLFNENLRIQKRKKLNLESKLVIGHVGRLSYQKNHKFLIQVFSEVVKKEPNAILLLIGRGEKEKEIQEQVHRLKLDKTVVFLGNRDDVNELYQVMDVFVMPSLFEGVPVVGVEAQFANLPCVFSDKVPSEVKFSERTEFINLNESPTYWADKILKCSQQYTRKKNCQELINSNYNIKNAKKILENIYLEKSN